MGEGVPCYFFVSGWNLLEQLSSGVQGRPKTGSLFLGFFQPPKTFLNLPKLPKLNNIMHRKDHSKTDLRIVFMGNTNSQIPIP